MHTHFLLAALVLPLAGCGDLAHLLDELPGGFRPADYVSDAKYGALLVEVDAVDGKRSATEVDTSILDSLDALTDEDAFAKPDGVRILDDDVDLAPLGDEDDVHTFGELSATQDRLVSLEPKDGEARMHILWVDGHYEDDSDASSVLGFAYNGDRIVMLADNIERACTDTLLPFIEEELCARTTATVLLHEIGHLFGLVNNGAPMQRDHQDEENGAHDENEDCLMYFAAETSTVAGAIAERIQGGEEDIPFDDECLDDLRALAAN